MIYSRILVRILYRMGRDIRPNKILEPRVLHLILSHMNDIAVNSVTALGYRLWIVVV